MSRAGGWLLGPLLPSQSCLSRFRRFIGVGAALWRRHSGCGRRGGRRLPGSLLLVQGPVGMRGRMGRCVRTPSFEECRRHRVLLKPPHPAGAAQGRGARPPTRAPACDAGCCCWCRWCVSAASSWRPSSFCLRSLWPLRRRFPRWPPPGGWPPPPLCCCELPAPGAAEACPVLLLPFFLRRLGL